MATVTTKLFLIGGRQQWFDDATALNRCADDNSIVGTAGYEKALKLAPDRRGVTIVLLRDSSNNDKNASSLSCTCYYAQRYHPWHHLLLQIPRQSLLSSLQSYSHMKKHV